MAYVVSSLTTSSAAASANFTPNLPAHLTNDLLLVFMSNDGGGTTIAAPAGWATIGTQAQSGANRSAWMYKIAASAAEEDPTATGANDDWAGIALVIRDADTTNPFAGLTDAVDIKRGDYTGTTTAASPAITTATNSENLLIYGWSSDAVPGMTVPIGSLSFCDYVATGSAVSAVAGWLNQAAPGAAPSVTMTRTSSTNGGNSWILSVKNKTAGGIRGECIDVASPVRVYGTGFEAGTYTAANATPPNIATIDTIALSATAGSLTDSSVYTMWQTSAESTTNWVGGWDSFTPKDLTGALLSIRWQAPTLSTGVGTRGVIIVFADSTDAWKAFRLARNARAQMTSASIYRSYIDLDGGSTYATGVGAGLTAFDSSDVVRVGFLYERTAVTTSRTFIFNPLYNHATGIVFCGGNNDTPATPADIDFSSAEGPAVTQPGFYGVKGLCGFQGSQQVILPFSLQIGDGGTSQTFVKFSGASIETPLPYADNHLWNVADNKLSVIIYAGANDSIDLSSAILRANSPQIFQIHASSTAADIYDFNGLLLDGWTVTDNVGLSWIGTTFTNGGTVTIAGGGDLTNCTISNTTSTNAALAITANGTVLDGCTVDGTGAAYALELGTAVTAITLTDCTITAGSTDKVHVLATTGTVTITIDGTTTLASGDVTSEGAMVDIVAPQPTLSATVLANTRVVLYNRTTAAELDNTFVSGTSWSKVITSGASSGNILDLYTFKEGYEESVATIIYAGDDAAFAVEQATDDAVQYYRITHSITDYTTLTEFNYYSPDVYIQSDDADGVTALQRLFIFCNGILTEEDGARYFRGSVTYRSAFDVVINRSVTGMQVDNVSATLGLAFSDEATMKVTTDDGSSWIAAPSAPGSIRYAFGVAPGQVETGVSGLTGPESAQLMALPSAATAANAVRTELTDELTQTTELWRRHGLDIAAPLTQTATAITAGDIDLAISGDPDTSVTVTRQP